MTLLALSTRIAQIYGSAPSGQTITLTDIVRLVTDVVNVILIIAGVVVVGVIFWAGIMMATSGSNDTRYKSAKTMLKNGIIGAIVILGVGTIVRTIASFAQAPTQIIR